MDGNPMASLEHSQLFVIFQLRSLNCLDGKQISEEERQMADKRFAQGNSVHRTLHVSNRALCHLHVHDRPSAQRVLNMLYLDLFAFNQFINYGHSMTVENVVPRFN